MKQSTLDLIKNINENTFIPATTQNELFELFQLDTVADLRKVSRNFMKVYELLEHFDNQTSNATEEKEGIVKFGTEAGNAIDAKTWKQAIGQTLGGYVSKVENKEAGKWYINDLTDGKIYKCIQSHTSTSFDITKFVDITNVGLSDKVENLFKFGKDWVSFPNGLKIQWGFSVAQNGDDIVRLISPFKSSDYQVVACDSGGGTYITGMAPLTNETFKACGRDPYTLAYKSFGFRWVAIGY